MVDRYLRPWKARAYAPLVRALRHVPPDAASAAGVAAGLAAAGFAAAGRFAPALALWLLNRFLDGLDGELARTAATAPTAVGEPAHTAATAPTAAGEPAHAAATVAAPRPARPPLRGAYLDLMLDLTVYAALPLGIAAGVAGAFGTPPLAGDASAWPAAAAALAAFYLNLGSWALLAPALTATEAAAAGAGPPAEPSAAAPGLRMPSGLVEGAETVVAFAVALAWPTLAVPVLWLLAAATAAGAAQRTAWGLRRLGRAGAAG